MESLVQSSQAYWRQLDILNPDNIKNFPITIIGVGAIGSFTALSLAKMGASNLTVYDDDSVEIHNLPNQFYKTSDIMHKKSGCLNSLIKEMTDIEIHNHFEKFSNQQIGGIVISAVDSMKARMEIWNRIKLNPAVELYIDGRMGGQVFRVYSIRPTDYDDIKLYESNLYSDEEAVDEACTNKAIIYNVLGIASIICNSVKRFVNGEELFKELHFDYVTLTCQRA